MSRVSTHQLIKYVPRKGLHQKNTCIVDHDNKNTFIAISKNASTSLRGSMKKMEVITEYKNMDGYETIAILRDPVDRFLSAYEEAFYKRSTVPAHIKRSGSITAQMGMALDELMKGNYFDLHLMPQIWFITDVNGNLLPITKFIDFTNIKAELNEKCNLNMVHSSTTKSSHKAKLKNALNKDIIDKINDFYYLDNIIIQTLKLTK